MQRIKKITAIILSVLILSSICVFGSTMTASAKGTGAGLAEWALNAYQSGWSYVYGGSTPGAVDCSGLIYSYCGGERCGDPQLNTASERGSVSSGVPRVHGLGLWQPGHVGVYIGNGMEVDARNDDAGVCYNDISYMSWTYWFKLAACTYVNNGWEQFCGDYYYYENGQYVVNTSRTIGGTTYNFSSSGKSDKTPSDMSSTSSSSSSSSGSSSSSSSSSSTQTSWRNGSSGSEVKKIQQRLTDLGYYTGAVDGEFGDATEQAYRAFQKAAGLTVDGIAGSDRDVLYSDDAPEYQKPDDSKSEEDTQETTAPVEETTAPTEETTVQTVFKSGDEGDKVTAIQNQLAQLGYFDIEATGFYGDYTVQAVQNFQLINDIEATGIVDENTYNVLFSDNAVKNTITAPTGNDSTGSTDSTVEAGPYVMPASVEAADYIISNDTNKTYTDTAVKVVKKTNTVTKKALSNSASKITSPVIAAQVSRNANVWLWFALVGMVLASLSTVLYLKNRKSSRYSRYSAKKRKKAEKTVQTSSRW